MPRSIPDHESLPVMVPRNSQRLVPIGADRVKRLQRHLQDALRDLERERPVNCRAARLAPEPDGFHAVVARAACSLCRGHCCGNGDDDAFLDHNTLARVRLRNPAMTGQATIALYVSRVPAEGYRGSCIFHGRRGCALDRSMRADVCNTYFCRGLGDYVRGRAAPEPTIVIAGDSEKMWVSPVLTPPTR